VAVNTAFADQTEDEPTPGPLPASPQAAPAPAQPQGVLQVAPPAPAAQGALGGVLGTVVGGVKDLATLPFGILSEMGANVQTRIAEDHFMQQQRQMMLNAMGQHLAAIHDMGQALLSKNDKDNYNLLMAAPDEYIKTRVGNLAYQLAKGGDSELNSEGVGPTAPMMSVQDGTPITQTPGQTTITGPRLPGTITAGNGVFTDSHAGPVGTYSQPTIVPAGGNLVGAPTTVSSLNGAFGGVPPTGTPTAGPAPTGEGVTIGGDVPPAVGGQPAITWGLKALSPQARAIAGQIVSHPAVAGLSAQDKANIIGIGYSESRFNPAAQNGSSTSLFQFQPTTFRQFMPNGDINNVNDQIEAEAKMYGANKASLASSLGRDPLPSDLYLGAMQGPTGAAALLTAPAGTNAVTALRNAGVSSQKALASIAGNIPGMPYKTQAQRTAANSAAMQMSAQQFAQTWSDHFNANMAHVFGGGAQAGGAPSVAPTSPQGAVASPAASPQATVASGGSVIAQGRQNQDIPPAQAIQQGLAPGRWQIDPTGKKVLVSPAPKADVDRVAGFGAALDTLGQLRSNMEQFNQHYANMPQGSLDTGPLRADVEVRGHDINPISAFGPRLDPNIGSMEALHNQQTFLAKPANAGARVLQAEIPFWTGSVQDPANAPGVNQSRYQDVVHAQAVMQAKQQFYQNWLYQNGSLNGADTAFAKLQQRPAGGGQPAAAAPVKRFRYDPGSGQLVPQ
jgi:hypothetical protein